MSESQNNSTNAPEIPTVDWHDLENDREKFLRELRYALAECGFLILTNAPGLDDKFQQQAFKEARNFFDAPSDFKKAFALQMTHMLEAILQQRQATQVMAKSSRAFSMALTKRRYVLTMTNLIHFTNASFAGLIPGRTQRKCQAFVPFSRA